jgi:hypothetical protein
MKAFEALREARAAVYAPRARGAGGTNSGRLPIKRSFFVAFALSMLGLFGFGASGASAAAICEGPMGPGTISGNLEARAGCELNGTTVTGNVTVASGGSIVLNGATVGGNLKSTGATSVTIKNGSSVGGNAKITGTAGGVQALDSTVRYNLKIVEGAPCVAVERDTVGGYLKVLDNQDTSGCSGATGISVRENTVGRKNQAETETPCTTSCVATVGTSNGSATVFAAGNATLLLSVNASGPLNCEGYTGDDPNIYETSTSPPGASLSGRVVISFHVPLGTPLSTQNLCFQAKKPFNTLHGSPLRQSTVDGVTVFTGLLAECHEGEATNPAPCLEPPRFGGGEVTNEEEIELEVIVPELGDPRYK